jgi:hypothetical protein
LGAARPRIAVPTTTVSAPAKSARLGSIGLPGRGAKLVVRADGEGLDRDAPELQEKFAIIGCVFSAFSAARLCAARLRPTTTLRLSARLVFSVYPKTPTVTDCVFLASSQVRRARVPELHVHIRPQERR